MPDENNEGIPAPTSPEAIEALAELEKEGHVVGSDQSIPDDGEVIDPPAPTKVETRVEAKPVDEPKKPDVEEAKPDRTPSMVETWKLKVAEDQKNAALKQVEELQAKLDDAAKQKTPITETQKEEIADDIKTIAEKAGVDPEFLTEFADTILKKAESRYKPDPEIAQTIQTLKEKEKLAKELEGYSNDFEKEVMPLLREKYPQLSDSALSELKATLKDFAFSETYSKVPLNEIFLMKESSFGLQTPRRASEGKGVKVRANEVVDYDNMDEETFNNLTPTQLEEFESHKKGQWNKPTN